jgi:hypothetical protein
MRERAVPRERRRGLAWLPALLIVLFAILGLLVAKNRARMDLAMNEAATTALATRPPSQAPGIAPRPEPQQPAG